MQQKVEQTGHPEYAGCPVMRFEDVAPFLALSIFFLAAIWFFVNAKHF